LHHYGLRGPSSSIDTVCSDPSPPSTMLAEHWRQENARAIAGGVHVVTPVSGPISFYSIKRAGFLGTDRVQCKPFLQQMAQAMLAQGLRAVV